MRTCGSWTKVSSAEIRISAGALARIVTVISGEKFTFEPVDMPSGVNKGDDIPAAYFPLECVVTARNLEPTNASRNDLLIESNADGSISYIYTTTQPCPQTIRFQNSRNHSGELVTIENPIFKTAYIGPALTLVAINAQHTTYLQNCVGYAVGQEALVTFYMSENAFARQARILFHAPNLAPSDMAGFSDNGNGCYYYTPPGPGLQTVNFRVTEANLDQDAAARTVRLYHDDMAVYTSLTYEYYLTEMLSCADNSGGRTISPIWATPGICSWSAPSPSGTRTTTPPRTAKRGGSRPKRSVPASSTAGANGT